MVRHLHYWRNNSQRQFEHSKLNANLRKSSSPKLLNRILRYYTQIVLGYVQLKFVQMDCTDYLSMDIFVFLDLEEICKFSTDQLKITILN